MADIVTDIGKEYIVDEQPDTDTLDVLLYDETTDTITEGDDLAAITSEPSTANDYARQTGVAISTSQIVGTDYGFDNDNEVQFLVGTNTETVDAVGFIANFTSSVAGDGSATDHLIAAMNMSQDRDLSNYDTITFDPGDLEAYIGNP